MLHQRQKGLAMAPTIRHQKQTSAPFERHKKAQEDPKALTWICRSRIDRIVQRFGKPAARSHISGNPRSVTSLVSASLLFTQEGQLITNV